jgi:phage terminase large subunit GpA-like protein
MDAFSDPLIETVTMMTSAQVGKTEMLNNIVGFFIHQDACPILLIQPTLEMGMAWSKDRLAPMVRDTPVLIGKVKDARAKDSQNTILHKTFPGGHITIAGANSPASLASRPVRVVLFDEVDRFPPSAGTEGDPVKLGTKRTKNFFNRKIMLTSTPTVSGVSRIEASWQQSDQRHYFVPCPRCGTFQKLVFSRTSKFANISGGQLKFDTANVTWAYYECEKCQAQLGELDKYQMIRDGRWEVNRTDAVKHAGFHLNELYSPWSSWTDVAREFIEAKQRRETLQVFVNTTVGETWDEEEAYTISDESLLSRREEYSKVPSGVVLLTVGCDTQDDRLELVIKGWGLDWESWLIAYRVIYGNPTDLTVWQSLNDILMSHYETESGKKIRIDCACIDSAGHYTQEVYKFIRSCGGRRVFAIFGRDGARPIVGKMTRNNVHRAKMFPVGVDGAKTEIYRRLALVKQADGTYPPGFMHFPMWAEESYFHGLVSEKQVIVRRDGFPRKVWQPKAPGIRNEPLDCEVYAYAAAALVNPNWRALRKRLDEQVASTPENPVEVSAEPARPSRPTFYRRKSFVTNF